MADYPEPLEADPDSVVTALEVGASMWSRGEQAEAMKWLRKAVDEAFEAGLDERGLELSKSAAAIASLVPPAPSAKPSATSTAAPPATVTAQPAPNAGTVPPPVVHAPAPAVSAAPPAALTTAPQAAPSPPPPVVNASPSSVASVTSPVANPAPPPVASEPPPRAPSSETSSLKPPAAAAAPAPQELRAPEPDASEPAAAASAKRLSVPLPPPVPRTPPPRPLTGRNRSSRPPGGLRTASARPPVRGSRGDDSSRPAPKTPTEEVASARSADASAIAAAEAARLAVEDVSTRLTVPSDAPSKIDVMAVHDAAEKRADEAREEVVDRPRFDRKFLTPLAMPRTATPPRPISVPHAKEPPPAAAPEPPRVEERALEEHSLEGIVLAVTPSVPPMTEPPEGATRPALPDEGSGSHERSHSPRAQWTTTGAVRVAVSREGGRVTLRAYDGGALHDGEVEALLVATPDVERLFRMLEVDGSRGA